MNQEVGKDSNHVCSVASPHRTDYLKRVPSLADRSAKLHTGTPAALVSKQLDLAFTTLQDFTTEKNHRENSMAQPKFCLKTIDGEVVTVDGDKLCAVDVQNGNEQRVRIQEKPQTPHEKMAFIFRHDNKNYVPMVKDRKLQLQKQGSKESPKLPENYYFKKHNFGAGDHYGLQSVAEPDLYICERADKSFCLSSKNDNPVRVTNEEI